MILATSAAHTSAALALVKLTTDSVSDCCCHRCLQAFAIYPQAVNVTPIVLTKAEADGIAYNIDPAKGYVFKPPKND